MTPKEIESVLSLLEVEYPNSFRSLSDQQKALKLRYWCKEFRNDDGRLVKQAIHEFVSLENNSFAPTIGQIREKMYELSHKSILTDAEAWMQVYRACQNGIYGYIEEWEKLSPEVKTVVGRPERLRDWAITSYDFFTSTVATNFKKEYQKAVAALKKEALLKGLDAGDAEKKQGLLTSGNGGETS